MKLSLEQNYISLQPFSVVLPELSILTGINGAGKTQILTGISTGTIRVFEDDAINIEDILLKTSGDFSLPNGADAYHIDEGDVNLTFLQQFRVLREGRPGGQTIEEFYSNKPSTLKFLKAAAQFSNKTINELEESDFYSYYPIIDLDSNLFAQNLAMSFRRYHTLWENNDYTTYRNKQYGEQNREFTTQEFEDLYGTAPWLLINDILEDAGLPYRVNSPKGLRRDAPFHIQLENIYSKARVSFDSLSSGEKVMMSIALALYNSANEASFPKVLLLDEPDASLHPSMIRQFLKVIENVFVGTHKIKVIITTHSPSTVALAPECSLFVVNNSESRIEKVSKDSALKVLTAGVPSFSVNYENRRQVFVESKNDVVYYEKLYLKISEYLEPEISLTFISSGEMNTDKNGMKVSNCRQVINATNTLRSGGNKFVWGIIDRDKSNISEGAIVVLGNGIRYSIENYLLDPLLIAGILLRDKVVNNTRELGTKALYGYSDLNNLNQGELQTITNNIVEKIAKLTISTDVTLINTKLLNGVDIELPRWYLDHQGHQLEKVVVKAYPELNKIKKGKEELLKLEILNKVVDDYPGLLSNDFLETLKKVQDH